MVLSAPEKILDNGPIKRFAIFAFPTAGGNGLNEIAGNSISLVTVGEWISFCSFVDENSFIDETLVSFLYRDSLSMCNSVFSVCILQYSDTNVDTDLMTGVECFL